MRPHLRDIPIDALASRFEEVGIEQAQETARRVALEVHARGKRRFAELAIGRRRRTALEAHFRLEPMLEVDAERVAEDGTRKLLLALRSGERIEVVLLRNAKARTACLSSQAGCALGCTFCATGTLGLFRHLTAGEITESLRLLQEDTGERISDVVFMGQGEPLHAYDAVMTAAANMNHAWGPSISRRRITISTSGLTPQIHRYTAEGHPWRLHFSLHSAIQETRARIMPIAERYPLPGLLDAIREYAARRARNHVTLQYIALPGINMDAAHVDALARELRGLRYILNVIPYNEIGAGFRPPTWAEVKAFTTALRRLDCPVKIRYSGGKQEGMGCGQLAAETLRRQPTGGHMVAPPGIFTDLSPGSTAQSLD